MARKPGDPPRWFVLAIFVGMLAGAALLALLLSWGWEGGTG